MQSTKLSDYLTPRENRKIDKILDKAAKRAKQKHGDTVKVVKAFLFLKCPLQKEEGGTSETHPECWQEMVKLLESIWGHCQKRGCCHYIFYDGLTGEVDDELPFD